MTNYKERPTNWDSNRDDYIQIRLYPLETCMKNYKFLDIIIQ